MTRIAKGKQNGELWDRVRLDNGLVGYVFQNYVAEVKDIPVEQIKLSIVNNTIQKNETVTLGVEILPTTATNKTLKFTSSNPEIASVDSNGKIRGISSGKATITAKSSNNITSSITINVNSKVTGLQLPEEEIGLQVGESYKIVPTVLPQDATNPKVSYSSVNSQIASVDENGTIIAISEGTTKIKVTTQDQNYEKEMIVTVIPKLPEGAVNFSNELKVVGNQITGVQEQTAVNEFLNKITSIYTIEIEDAKGQKLTDKNLVGTGSKVKLYDGNKLVIEYDVILYGDVNGDGKINSVDLLVLQRHILEIKKLTGKFLKAGNIDKTGKKPSSVDLLKIQRHILEIKLIEQ